MISSKNHWFYMERTIVPMKRNCRDVIVISHRRIDGNDVVVGNYYGFMIDV